MTYIFGYQILRKSFFFHFFIPLQVFEEDLHCVPVGFWQLLDQVFDCVHALFVVRTFWSGDRDGYPTQNKSVIVWH